MITKDDQKTQKRKVIKIDLLRVIVVSGINTNKVYQSIRIFVKKRMTIKKKKK